MDRPRSSLVSCLALAAVLCSFVTLVVTLHPANLFGQTEDDSIYLSSAKALAEGKGYILASFPGHPPASKYPIFYAWILSFVWRFNPSFPANLNTAIAISVLAGMFFIVGCFFFFRKCRALSEMEVLILTAVCGLNPIVVFYSGSILSEIPFAALALAAMLVADTIIERDSKAASAAICGLLCGLCMLTRIFGVPVAAGIVLAAGVRRNWRQCLVFCGGVAPFFIYLAWRVVSAKAVVPAVSQEYASNPSWIHTWAYYTNYLEVWKQGVPSISVFGAVLKNNLLILLATPASYFLSPLIEPRSAASTSAIILIALWGVIGILRERNHDRGRPIYFILPMYLLLVLLWNYADAERFMIPFLPLLVVGIWLEFKRVAILASSTLKTNAAVLEKAIAAVLMLVVITLGFSVAVNYFGAARKQSLQISEERGAILDQKREAYDWILRSTPPEARIVSYEDGALYLYTHRTGVRPFTFTSAEFFNSKMLSRDLCQLGDVAYAVKASYWVTSDDDYALEWHEGYLKARERMKLISERFPMVFRSHGGRVTVRLVQGPFGRTPSGSECPQELPQEASSKWPNGAY